MRRAITLITDTECYNDIKWLWKDMPFWVLAPIAVIATILLTLFHTVIGSYKFTSWLIKKVKLIVRT